MSDDTTSGKSPVTLDDWDSGEWDDWPVEPSPVGPQGVFLRAEDVDQDSGAVQPVVPLDGEEGFPSPEARAQERFDHLATAFSTTLVIVAQMYRDEDWKYLRKEDGSEYRSLVEVCQVAMSMSVSMARRYVQGARDFYLPLSAVMVEGTRLEIASSDVASLGGEGIRSVVDEATERLDGVDDPDEATEIVSDTIKGAREERDKAREKAREGDSPGSDDGDGGREFHEHPEPDAVGPVETYTGDEDEWPSAPSTSVAGAGDSGGENYFVGSADEDLIAPLLSDAPLFHDDAALDALPVAVKRVVRAMLVLEEANVDELARSLNYENRGIIVHGDAAQKSLARIRSLAETQPWVFKGLDRGE